MAAVLNSYSLHYILLFCSCRSSHHHSLIMIINYDDLHSSLCHSLNNIRARTSSQALTFGPQAIGIITKLSENKPPKNAPTFQMTGTSYILMWVLHYKCSALRYIVGTRHYNVGSRQYNVEIAPT
jgi:hypothetical protein